MKTKPLTRGISKSFAVAFKKSELFKLYLAHKDELYIGVRNKSLNLYYNCDSIAKLTFDESNSKIMCELDRYYKDGKHHPAKESGKTLERNPKWICDEYSSLKNNSDKKPTPEKKAQSKLIIKNNNNKNSKWFCVDIEYVKQFKNKAEKKKADYNGRFDIIALSKARPHKVALIELKYGAGSMGGKSGIRKHVSDFKKFQDKGYFENHLKGEISDILKSQIALGIHVPNVFHQIFELEYPEFYFITLNNNAKNENASTPKQTMAGHLFSSKEWGCKRLASKMSVQSKFGDLRDKDNPISATFLFSKSKLPNIGISDIIDGDYDEKIPPTRRKQKGGTSTTA